MNQKKLNEALANDLKDYCEKHNLEDTRVYFNNKAYCFSSMNKDGMKVLEDISPSTYFEYANDDTVSMSFEGLLYDVINYNAFSPELKPMLDEFDSIFKKHNVYYELGHAWNLAVYPID